jgi:hypothetical protein
MGSRTYDPPPPAPTGAGEGPPPPPPPFGGQARPQTPPPVNPQCAQEGEDDEKLNPASEALHRIKGDINELKEYASYYVAAKVDGFKRTIRNIGLYAALGVVGLIAGGAIIATAAGLLIVGLAAGLSRLFDGHVWLADIVTGILVLAIIGAGAWYMMNKLTGAWRSQTIRKYEQRKQSQRERFDHDVSGRAAEAGRAAGNQKRQ